MAREESGGAPRASSPLAGMPGLGRFDGAGVGTAEAASSLRKRGELGTREARAAATGGWGVGQGGEGSPHSRPERGSARRPGTGREGAPAQPGPLPPPPRPPKRGPGLCPELAASPTRDLRWGWSRPFPRLDASCALGTEQGATCRIALLLCAGCPSESGAGGLCRAGVDLNCAVPQPRARSGLVAEFLLTNKGEGSCTPPGPGEPSRGGGERRKGLIVLGGLPPLGYRHGKSRLP